MKYSIFIYLFVNLSFSINLYSQKSSPIKKAQNLYDLAGKEIAHQNIFSAIDHLQKAVHIDPNFATAFQQLGDLHRKNKNYKEAIKCYRNVLEIDPNLTSLTKFGLGEALLFEGEYSQALPFLENYKKQKLSEKSLQLVNKYISDCTFALNNKSIKPSLLKKLPETINTANNEYFPKLTADNNTIIFTRKENNQENFYISEYKNKQWINATKLSDNINSEFFNEGAHCISPDGKYLFFTGCNRPGGLGSCDIYVSKHEYGVWSEPFNLGAPINSRGWEAQPAISADGKTLYFVSNRAGGFGGNDIWKSELDKDGNWQAPTNLGSNINTPFNENSPFIHADNSTLYFSSDGWPGFGQSDLYLSKLDTTGNWSTPLNLGNSLNDNHNQTSLHISMDGKHGFIASEDKSKQIDLYTFDVPTELKPHPIAYFQGKILDEKNLKPIDGQIIVTNLSNKKVVFEGNADYVDGQFLATLPIGDSYAIHIQKENYLFTSLKYDLSKEEFENERILDTILLKPITIGSLALLNNIFFEVDKAELLQTSITELYILLNFMKLNKNVHIEIAGHTDNSGTQQRNIILSKERADAVKDFLIINGISEKRLFSNGYGQIKPIADNQTEEGRRLNRRTEFKIIK